MSKAQEIGKKVSGPTLDADRRTQDAVVDAVTAWTETANKIPGYARLNKQFPAATEVIDSNLDFTGRSWPASPAQALPDPEHRPHGRRRNHPHPRRPGKPLESQTKPHTPGC